MIYTVDFFFVERVWWEWGFIVFTPNGKVFTIPEVTPLMRILRSAEDNRWAYIGAITPEGIIQPRSFQSKIIGIHSSVLISKITIIVCFLVLHVEWDANL